MNTDTENKPIEQQLVDLSVKCSFLGESNIGTLTFQVEGHPTFKLGDTETITLAKEAISLLNRYISGEGSVL